MSANPIHHKRTKHLLEGLSSWVIACRHQQVHRRHRGHRLHPRRHRRPRQQQQAAAARGRREAAAAAAARHGDPVRPSQHFIDGLWSAHSGERIIVFTTNLVDKLDPALIRRGRMDMHVERCPTAASSGLHHAVDETRNLSVGSPRLPLPRRRRTEATVRRRRSQVERKQWLMVERRHAWGPLMMTVLISVMMIVPVPATNDDKAKAEAGGRDLVTVSRNRDEKRGTPIFNTVRND